MYHARPLAKNELREQPGEGGVLDYSAFEAERAEWVLKGAREDTDVLALLEVHCFEPEIVPVLLTLANEAGMHILVEGAPLDVRHEPIGFVGEIMAHAEVIETCTSTCTKCHEDGGVYVVPLTSPNSASSRNKELCPDCFRKLRGDTSARLDHSPRFGTEVGPLTFVYGPPLSGRSDYLVNYGNKALVAYPANTQAFRPTEVRNREPAVIGNLVSLPIEPADSLSDVFARTKPETRVLMLDMLDLFQDASSVDNIKKLREIAHNKGVFVVCYGSAIDSNGKAIGSMSQLLCLADRVARLRATCRVDACREREYAIYFLRKAPDPQSTGRYVVDKEGVGAVTLCRRHFQGFQSGADIH